jgi:hypothetical protein
MLEAASIIALSASLMSPVFSTDVANTAFNVADKEESIFTGKNSKQKTARFLVVWVSGESKGDPFALGDSGEAWGSMQIHYDIWKDLIQEDPFYLFELETSMKVSLRIIRYLNKFCNDHKINRSSNENIRRALNAYSSGSCDGNKTSIELVNNRCKMIGC